MTNNIATISDMGLCVDFGGSMTMPEVAIGVLSRAAIFALATGFIPMVRIWSRKNHLMRLCFLPIIGAIMFAFAFPSDIEYGITRTLYVNTHAHVCSIGFFSWPSRWIAPIVGIPIGFAAGVISMIWMRKRKHSNERFQPTAAASPSVDPAKVEGR